jgi:hypothetical protein
VANTEEAGPSNKTSSSSTAFLDRRQEDSLMVVDKEKGRRRSLVKIIKKDKIGTAKKRTQTARMTIKGKKRIQTARMTIKGANGGGRMLQLAKWSKKTIKRQVSMDKQEQPRGELKGQEHGEQRTGRVEGRKPQQDYEAKLLATNGFLRFQILL